MSGDALAESRFENTRWRRLRFTPLRDMLRGRISGRLDRERIIAEAELPASLADVVRETARRTRLSRIEKAEVTRELAAHFRDGLDAGATHGDLLGSFGDPRAAAYLIRRAKRRCRPAPVRAMSWAIRVTLVALACVLSLAAALTARLYLGEPKLTRNFVAEMNAPIRDIPREDRAWPLYREAFLATPRWPEVNRREFHPHSEHWPELVAFVDEHADLLDTYRAAAAKPHLGRPADTVGDPEVETRHGERPGVAHSSGGPADENPMVISVLLPHLVVLREAARLTAIDAQAAAIAGDGPRAFRDLKAILAMADHAAETPTLISDLVSLAILALEAQVVGEILAAQPETLTDDQLIEMSHRLAAARGGGVLRVRIESERKYFEDIVQRIYTDDGDGDGHIIAAGVDLISRLDNGADSFFELPTVARLGLANRREMSEKYDQLMSAWEAEARIPLWERTESRPGRGVRSKT